MTRSLQRARVPACRLLPARGSSLKAPSSCADGSGSRGTRPNPDLSFPSRGRRPRRGHCDGDTSETALPLRGPPCRTDTAPDVIPLAPHGDPRLGCSYCSQVTDEQTSSQRSPATGRSHARGRQGVPRGRPAEGRLWFSPFPVTLGLGRGAQLTSCLMMGNVHFRQYSAS